MKKIFTIIAALFITLNVFAQAPQKMSYQAVIRNSSDQLVTNHLVGMKISILHDSVSGTVVYSETQSPTTNANGLVNIAIGGGTGFNTIDWSDGPYFIKTETDPTGGTTYTITGTSQLLSVPYALQAGNGSKWGTTANDLYYTSGSVGVGNDTCHTSAILDLSSTTKGFLPPRMTLTEITNIVNPAEGLLVYNTTSKKFNLYNGTYWVDMNGNYALLQIGQAYADGYIFYLDASGAHGMVISGGYNGSAAWGCKGTAIPGADGTGIGTGYQNTLDIVAACTTVGIGAWNCSTMTSTNYSDWYMPSKDEIYLAVTTLQPLGIGGFGSDNIWSSSEVDADNAWIYLMSGSFAQWPKNVTYYSRGIRNF